MDRDVDPAAAPGAAPTLDGCALLGRVAGLLADGGDDVVSVVLSRVVAQLHLRSAVLRDAVDGQVLGVAGDVVHAVPASREACGPQGVIELPVPAGGRTVAALTVVGSRPADLPVLRAVAAVLALGLRREPGPRLPLSLLAAADAAAAAAADALHDGPVQQLVAARYAADAAVRGGSSPTEALTVRDAVQASLVALRRSLWQLRPRGAAEGLAAVLPQLSCRLQEADRPGLLLDVDAEACARLTSRAASVCYRLVQEVAGRPGGPATAVRVRAGRDIVRLEVDGDVDAVDAAAHLWSARARALGADLALPGGGRVVLLLPVPAPNRSPDEPRRSS